MKSRASKTVGLGKWAAAAILAVLLALASCQQESKGFVLPEGDTVDGKVVFTELNCSRCHSIDDIKWSGTEQFGDPYVKLGGDVSSIKTYGELVTSVINPSHKIERRSLNSQKLTLTKGMSKMELYQYNDVMTVHELIDLVSYLQEQYNVVRPSSKYTYTGF